MFNANYDNLEKRKKPTHWTQNPISPLSGIGNFKAILDDYFNGKLPAEANSLAKGYEAIGLNAYVNAKGFRPDGSMYYGAQIEKLANGDSTALDFGFKDTFDRIRKGNRRFQYGTEVNEAAVKSLAQLLRWCTEHSIEVVGFFPPYADAVYAEMQSSGKYIYFPQLVPSIRPVFDEFGYSLYAFHTASECGSTDAEFLDGFHGGEAVYRRIAKDLSLTSP